jgi:hypothetical protein
MSGSGVSVTVRMGQSILKYRLSGFDCVRVLKAGYQQLNHDRAALTAAMVEVGLCGPASEDHARMTVPEEFSADEIRAAPFAGEGLGVSGIVRSTIGECWGGVMGKQARIGLLLGAMSCLVAVMIDWVIQEL